MLLIMVDDLNTMIEPMGDRQAITPNLTKLASRGMLFTNAQSIAPQCNAIRTAALFGVLPSTSGVYGNAQDWRAMELFAYGQKVCAERGLSRAGGYRWSVTATLVLDAYDRAIERHQTGAGQ